MIILFGVIPGTHAQLIPKPSLVPRDGKIEANQIVEDKSRKPLALNVKPQLLGSDVGCPPSIAKMSSNAGEANTVPYFLPPINVATAAGADVRRIIVDRWEGGHQTWADVVRKVQKVWAGRFDSGYDLWSEVTVWNVSATIEFENKEERGCLRTDGVHVSLRDVNGVAWRLRLLPAAR